MRRGLYTLLLSSCNNFSFSEIVPEESAPDRWGATSSEGSGDSRPTGFNRLYELDVGAVCLGQLLFVVIGARPVPRAAVEIAL